MATYREAAKQTAMNEQRTRELLCESKELVLKMDKMQKENMHKTEK